MRFIKTNSAVNLSRKPGLDLSCDLLQHLQGVLCIYMKKIQLQKNENPTLLMLVPSLKLSFI